MEYQPHILIFPFPLQGHIKAMLPLAELICHAGLHVTFLNTEPNHHRLTRIHHLSARFSTLNFASISDGMPEGCSDDHRSSFKSLVASLSYVTKTLFRDLLLSNIHGDDDDRIASRITCIISDGGMSFAADVAAELGIPFITYRTASALYLWANICLQQLVELGHVPVKEEDMDELLTGIAGFDGLVRKRDLPSFCRVGDTYSEAGIRYLINEANGMRRGSGLILNTFDDLESPALSLLAPFFRNIYTIGPLHACIKTRIGDEPLSCMSNLWQEDQACMEWLDSKPQGSVIYVSFGSLVSITQAQMFEFWNGLVNSGSPFLWVTRKGSLTNEEGPEGEIGFLPSEIELETKDRGLFVEWAPQEEVLSHPSVGGFLTHTGWNSTLESVVGGVPMLCWPQIGDQQLNSRWVSEKWKIGIDMKDTCDRKIIGTMVRDLMGAKRERLNAQMESYAKMAKESVSPGGSSYTNVDKLIDDLRSM